MAKKTPIEEPLESVVTADITDNTPDTSSTEIRVLDVEKSPEDSRDWVAEHLLGIVSYPSTLDLRGYCQPVRDQGSQGACAAMAGSAMKEAQEYKDCLLREYLSPQFIYNLRENKTTSGMYMRDLMSILSKTGVCKETTYPYLSTSKITATMNTEAAKYKIKSYAAITSIEGLKASLYSNGPAVIAVPVYNYSTTMWNPQVGNTLLGGHAMCCVGYDATGFIIRNSWGTGWGNSGYTVFPYTHWGKQWEIWTTMDILTGVDKPTPATKKATLLSVIGGQIKRFFGVRGSFVVNACECKKVPRAKRD